MLSLSIKDGEGFTVGPDIVIKFRHDPKGRSCQVYIQAPRKLGVMRVDAPGVALLVQSLKQVELETGWRA